MRRAVERALNVPSAERIVGRLEGKGILGPAVEQALASEGRGSEDPGVSLPSLPAPAERPPATVDDLVDAALSDDWPADGERVRREAWRQPGPNVENVRSSAQAKRDVQARPKGKR